MNGEGDCRYLAPEVLNSPSTPQSDIFSLGMSIVHLATGIEPPKKVQQRKQLSLPPRFTSEFQNLLKRMLDSDPSKRPTAKDLLRNPLLIPNAISPRFHREVLIYLFIFSPFFFFFSFSFLFFSFLFLFLFLFLF